MSIFISVLICELILRLFYADEIVLFPRYHTKVKFSEYTLRMNRPDNSFYHTSVEGKWKFEINSRGFRNNRNISYEKPENTFRVLSLGDSHTLGFEVNQDETFSFLLEKKIKENNHDAEVLNAGVSGFSTAEEYIYLINEGIKYKPDAVILGFFNNDFDDNIKTGLFELKEDSLIAKNYEHIPGVKIQDFIYQFSLVRWLSENSYFYSFSFNTVWNYAKQNLLKRSRENVIEYAVSLKRDFGGYQKKLAAKLIEKVYKFCLENNVILVIADIPALGKDGSVISSIPLELKDTFEIYSDKLISADKILEEVAKDKVHRAKGHRHISPETHSAIADVITNFLLTKIESKDGYK